MSWAIWLVILFALVYEPIVGYLDFQKFRADVKTNKKARTKYYINAMIGLWVPALFILLLAALTDLTYEEIGFAWPAINTQPLGPVATYLVFGLALFYLLMILYYLIGYRVSLRLRNQWAQVQARERENVDFFVFLPTNKKEKRLWNFLSLTAAITEEIIYRGFMIYALGFLFPTLSIWLIILFASVLFGLAHTYQGIVGVLRTTVFGFLFSLLYISLESILPLIFFHFLIDYLAQLGEHVPEPMS